MWVGVSFLLWKKPSFAISWVVPCLTHASVPVREASVKRYTSSLELLYRSGCRILLLTPAFFTCLNAFSWVDVHTHSALPVRSVSGAAIIAMWGRNCDI